MTFSSLFISLFFLFILLFRKKNFEFNKIKYKEVREAIIQEKLLLFSAVHPTARFTVYSAMDRNKYIYALADFAVVVSSSDNQGGTWAGATENLKNHWVPLFVRQDLLTPVGNEKLLSMGAQPLAPQIVNDKNGNLLDWFNVNQSFVSRDNGYTQLSLESYIYEEPLETNTVNNFDWSNQPIAERLSEVKNDLYPMIWTYLAQELSESKTNRELARFFNIQEKQMQEWLERALSEKKVKKLDDTDHFMLANE